MSLQYPVLYVFVVQCKYLCVYGGSGKDSSVKTTEKMKKAEKDKAAEEKKKAEMVPQVATVPGMFGALVPTNGLVSQVKQQTQTLSMSLTVTARSISTCRCMMMTANPL